MSSLVKYTIESLNIFKKNSEKELLEPLNCIIKLGLLTLKCEGTKLSIYNNSILFNIPWAFQGTLRWKNGDNRNDLHNLFEPLKKAIEWYHPLLNPNIRILFIKGIDGLKILETTYKLETESSLIIHTINHYINILEQALVTKEDKKQDAPVTESEEGGMFVNSNATMNQENDNLTEEYDKNSNSFKDIWNDAEINIVTNLLVMAIEYKDKDIVYDYLLEAIEKILEGKDAIVKKLLLNKTTKL